MPLELSIELPSVPRYERFALVGEGTVAPVDLQIRVRAEGDVVWQEKSLSAGEDNVAFEVPPGPVVIEARYTVAGLPASNLLNPTLEARVAALRAGACANENDVSYWFSRGRTTALVSESTSAVTLTLGNMKRLMLVPGGVVVRTRPVASSGSLGTAATAAKGVELKALDPVWNSPLPAACPGRTLGAARTDARGIASLRLPLFAEGDGRAVLSYASDALAGKALLPALSSTNYKANLHQLTLEGAGPGLALVEKPSDLVVEFGSGFFAELMNGVDASRICRGTNILGIEGRAVCDALARPADCAVDGATGCVSTAEFPAVNLALLSPGVLKKSTIVAGVVGEYPSASSPLSGASAATDLTSLAASTAAGAYEFFDSSGSRYTGVISDAGAMAVGTSPQTYNTSLYRQFIVPGDPNLVASNILSGRSIFGIAGNAAVRPADCSADGQSGCVVPASGTIKAADTMNFTGWDIRKKRNGTTGAVITFAGLAGQSKSCRNRANLSAFDNTASPAVAGLDFFDTISDYGPGAMGLPSEIPAWTVINSTDYGRDFACGGIYATGAVATGSTGADATLPHDPNGNWQDLTPGVIPGGASSTNTANGCNAADKHCVVKELISGLMVTEVAAPALTWQGAVEYCDTLGKAGGTVTSPIPTIGGAAYADWRLPTQKELQQLYYAGIRGLNETTNLTSFFGALDGGSSYFWSSSSMVLAPQNAWHMVLSSGDTIYAPKANLNAALCVR